MKKWLIPLVALVLVLLIVVTTWQILQTRNKTASYQLAMIAVGDKGERGRSVACGDSLVMFTRETVFRLGIREVYQDLLAERRYEFEQGLTSPLARTELTVDSVLVTDDGVAEILLSGKADIADTCDARRAKVQLIETARQFEGVKKVEVRINNVPLDQALRTE